MPLCAVTGAESKFLHTARFTVLAMKIGSCPPQPLGELRPLDTTYILM